LQDLFSNAVLTVSGWTPNARLISKTRYPVRISAVLLKKALSVQSRYKALAAAVHVFLPQNVLMAIVEVMDAGKDLQVHELRPNVHGSKRSVQSGENSVYCVTTVALTLPSTAEYTGRQQAVSSAVWHI
jgi:hypothetical protein